MTRPTTWPANNVFSFLTEGNVCTLSYTPIYTIQGSGDAAAITGNVTTQGVVVGDFEGPIAPASRASTCRTRRATATQPRLTASSSSPAMTTTA